MTGRIFPMQKRFLRAAVLTSAVAVLTPAAAFAQLAATNPAGAAIGHVHINATDLEVQQRHGVRYLRYWVDEEAGKLFCLAEAPSAQAAVTVHREAHGLLADRIYQVREGE